MNRRHLLLMHLQYVSGRMAVFLTAPMLVLLIKMIGYRVTNLKKHRQDIAALFDEHQGPWIICANHLTLIDSVILAYAMFPVWRYVFQYRLLPWNLPEKRNFQRNPVMTLLCYLLKCVPVVRGGNRDAAKICFAKCGYLLENGQNIMIFPEGTRSRSGRVDTNNCSYGPGRLAGIREDCRVLCLYLRGEHQESYSNIPVPNEVFSLSVATCDIGRRRTGLKAQRDCSRQIIEKIAEMEKAYFDARGQ